MPNSEVIGISHPCLIQRNVHIVAFTWPFSDIVEIALTQIRPKWTMFESVDGKVEHPLSTQDNFLLLPIFSCINRTFAEFLFYIPRVIVEHLLSCLAMVHIPINNEYFLNTFVVECVLGSNSNIVVETIATIFAFHSMMPRRSLQCKTHNMRLKKKLTRKVYIIYV